MSGTSIGYGFSFDDGGTSTTVNLNGLNATYAESESFIYSQSGPLTLNLTGSNSISCSNYYEAIYSKGDLKLSGNGTLTVTANATSYYGLIGSNYKNGSNSDASVLAADGYTVTRSDVTNNQDGTYTWTYTVADTKADYREGAWSGTAVTFTKKTASNPTEIANGYSGNIVSGWYTVTGDDVVISSDVMLTGDTHLILCDGAKLTVNGRIYGSKTYGLYVYGQESGTGKLVVNGGLSYAMMNLSLLEVHGGDITAESSDDDAIEHTPITVYGGKLTAKAMNTSYYFGINNYYAGNDINIYGGELVASCNSSYSAINLGLGQATLTVYGGKLSASSPQGKAIQGYIKSGTEGIKFYFADTEGDWDEGESYTNSQMAKVKPYAKAE